MFPCVCSNISADDMLYTETDLEESMDKIETINFHEVKEVAGIKFWCYHAGHVLGAAMFMIEIAGVKVGVVYSFKGAHLPSHTVSDNDHGRSLQLLYTGDFSRQEDRHLMAAEIPSVKPDILITVCTTVYAGNMISFSRAQQWGFLSDHTTKKLYILFLANK